ncbi:hypothetical protein [Roseateles sp. LKC17W]|uniref:Uncharacterized protein n=1 Tax=Pelomonas margarita TaxID=3299031 RepID=A0ABW7FCJ4_9BURK
MADAKGGVLGSFPWASVAVLVAFVASTQLVPQAFEALRPAEKARAQAPLDEVLEINARLWEDPFAALRRHELERAERCERQRKAGQEGGGDCGRQTPQLRDPQQLLARLDADQNRRIDDTLVVLALMPGADFVGAEEARRRIRYATLAGLLAQDYVPDNAERLSLLEFRLLDARGGRPEAAGPGYLVPYELLSLRREDTDNPPSRYAQIALLWVDETALPLRKLDAVARLTEQLMGAQALQRAALRFANAQDTLPRLAVIGPSSTDALRTALRDLRCAADLDNTAGIAQGDGPARQDAVRCARRGEEVGRGLAADVLAGYQLLARAEFYNPSSTAPERTLMELQPYQRDVTRLDDGLDAFLTQHFSRLTRAQGQPPPVRMVRTVGNDAALLEGLVAELRLRLQQKRRIVVVAERDSIYAQALVGQLRECLSDELRESLRVVYFFRGLDGVTTRDGSAAAPAAKTPTLEWPESRDQLDYLRRLGQSLRASEREEGRLPIGAVGIFASDVHDKLLVLQALHETFSDRVFFTTDMDARYLHPRTQSFTRNLVVASSLPLAFHAPAAAGGLDLQAGTPPLRDIYQTSTYAAARRAGCRSAACKAAEAQALDAVLRRTSVYEIGRSQMVPLAGYALEASTAQRPLGRVLVALVLAGLIGGMLLVWPSTPAMRQARQALLPGGATSQPMGATAMAFVVLHAVLLFCTVASLSEFVLPGRLDFDHARLMGLLAGGGALLVGLVAWRASARPRLAAGLLLALAALVALWAAQAWPATSRWVGGSCADCEPTVWLEGVSAWPSHLIHLLALCVLLWTLDWAWALTQQQLQADAGWLRLPQPQRQDSLASLLKGWRRHASVLRWPAGVGHSCDVRQLWVEYGERAEARPRLVRTLGWYVLTLAVMGLLFFGLNEGRIPEVPVRGQAHRSLVSLTLYAALLLLPLLIVAVADATVLLTRFVQHLNAGRSFYPPETVAQFAGALGEEHRQLWAQRFNARPQDRQGDGTGFPMHTLLDDWMDVQVVARLSAPIARLVIGPFIVLALLVVARSRLFDNWALTPAIAVGVSFYVAVLVGLTVLLKQAAETRRRQALAAMQADLRWLAGSGAPLSGLVEPFKRLITQVESEQRGAFAPFFEQPLLKAMLVPLGGAGGTQLFDYLLLAR